MVSFGDMRKGADGAPPIESWTMKGDPIGKGDCGRCDLKSLQRCGTAER